ncbi:MAG: N-acetyl-gamma-glutamyl-phosphate reductase [Oscillospiraceae bacterium]|nr:N-acetyl-gamma-glutamyl-phosphate reductase [Oscillospiraceae bacterium]
MKTKVFIDGREGTTGLQIYDRLSGRTDIELLQIDEDKRKDPDERRKFLNAADIVFLCLPDAAAREAVALIDPDNDHTAVIDASTAHRVAPGWVYGFPELTGQREKIASARRIANPGCYATGFISLIRPLVEKGMLSPDALLTVHALSGYTGAGKKAIAQYGDPGRDPELDSPRHYGLGLTHKHLPEMAAISGLTHKPIFAPMICDYPQGMVVAVSLFLSQLEKEMTKDDLRALYEDYYAGSPLISIRPADAPSCGFLGANNLAGFDGLQIFVCGNDEQVILLSRLDNLGKGASGAAVQNMNLLMGCPEETGLQL